ncbi:MAG: RNA polymerase subunit sigma-24 [Pseudonocardia sp.]|nr:RNA polymerase subunit sigma-24 [Pseudonocardia sp.]
MSVAAVEAVWRIESARLVAGLARFTGDVGAAEELAQDALVAALEQWPTAGVPPNPGGWLMTTAKNRAVDGFRRAAVHRRAVETIGRDTAEAVDERDAVDDALDDPVGDDVLRLLFTACHPALSREYRIALTLRCLSGLRTAEIGRAFLVPEPVAGQRISRAKKTLRDKGIRFAMPGPADVTERLASVLEVIYLVFNEGYSATAGEDWMRPELAAEALRLARLTAVLLPAEPEAHGLAALLELTQSRAAARQDADGRPVLLQHQDRRRWDRLLIRRGLTALARAHDAGLTRPGPPPSAHPSPDGAIGPYTLQAAIAACHATAPSPAATDWAQIAGLYDVLATAWPTPVVGLNRAMAHGRAFGADAGLALLDAVDAAALTGYPQLPAVRGELLALAGRHAEAADRFAEAAALTRNGPERDLFAERAAEALARVVG